MKIALALGGGGVRGFAHLGVIKTLLAEGINFDFIAGTSMGAVVGAGYALSKDIRELEGRLLELAQRKEVSDLESLSAPSELEERRLIFEKMSSFVKDLYLWNLRALKKWLFDGSQIRGLIEQLVQDKSFSDTRVPFACVAADLETAEEVVLNEGRLAEAIFASCSMPGVFPPVELAGRRLIDGGIAELVPVEVARRSIGTSGFVIGVNVEPDVIRTEFAHGMDIVFRADEIRSYHLNRMRLNTFCDFLITPEVGKISWAEFSKAEECIRRGQQATLKDLEGLKQKLKRTKPERFLKRIAEKFLKIPRQFSISP